MRPVGMAIVGAGDAGQRLAVASLKIADAYKDTNAYPRLVTIVDQDSATAADFARRFGFPRRSNQFSNMLEEPEICVVAISEPEHNGIAVSAAEAGKHLHLENHPFTGLIGAELLGAVMAAGVSASVSYPHFTNPSIVLFRELIASGELGSILHFRARLSATEGLTHIRGCQEGDACVQRLFKSALLGLLAIGRSTLGEIRTITFVDRNNAGCNGTIGLQFESGLKGTIEVCDGYLGASPSFQLETRGTAGAAAFNTYEPGWLKFQKRSKGVASGPPATIFPSPVHFPSNAHWAFRSPHFTPVELKAIELATFLAADHTPHQSFANLHDAKRLQELINAALVAAKPNPFGI